MIAPNNKTLGQAIDEVLQALMPLEDTARMTALRAACEHLDIRQQIADGAPVATSDRDGAGAASTPKVEPLSPFSDLRWLRERIRPKSSREMACLVAYYLEALVPVAERKSDVTASDMRHYFTLAGYPLPERPCHLLPNARACGSFEKSSYRRYRLSPSRREWIVAALFGSCRG